MRKNFKDLLAGTLLGASAMVVLIHPLLEILHLWRTDSMREASFPSLAFHGIRAAFSGSMLEMTFPNKNSRVLSAVRV